MKKFCVSFLQMVLVVALSITISTGIITIAKTSYDVVNGWLASRNTSVSIGWNNGVMEVSTGNCQMVFMVFDVAHLVSSTNCDIHVTNGEINIGAHFENPD